MSKAETPLELSEEQWLHINETITMLTLAVAQIEASILESEKSFGRLTQSFTTIVATVNAAPDPSTQAHELKLQLDGLKKDVHNAVVDFQFFDRLAQRLCHVKESLGDLGGLLQARERLDKPEEWKNLQQDLKGRYTMACEREMFDMILNGVAIETALAHFKANYLDEMAKQNEDDGDIDLF
ncbi:hypothetical protein EUZ85_04570 [Hahella sp. KA22]|uniref:hypothetical protein n=1 Tax=Hahella sp. KA22 TaxID=1628392 RepID=UPI000FDE3FE8|nr:hypothetical protein [Hahella sp. KA22]AZZ90018.1 hypothetical protein ENC22_02020 [Hahella sp. KA22]QAY53388.1 hypothetical protein EUZ85_04570 [Hahella sp. KA22]